MWNLLVLHPPAASPVKVFFISWRMQQRFKVFLSAAAACYRHSVISASSSSLTADMSSLLFLGSVVLFSGFDSLMQRYKRADVCWSLCVVVTVSQLQIWLLLSAIWYEAVNQANKMNLWHHLSSYINYRGRTAGQQTPLTLFGPFLTSEQQTNS